jgi:Uma2 family endonuclease
MGAATQLTFAEFERLPERAGKRELLEGWLIEMPPPQLRHTVVQKRLFRAIDAWVEYNGDGEAFLEAGFRIGEGWLQPDVSWVRQEQLAGAGKYFSGAPFLAVEVVSEFDRAAELDLKVSTLLAAGAAEVWVVYPDSREVQVYSAAGAQTLTDALRSGVLPGFELSLSALFA